MEGMQLTARITAEACEDESTLSHGLCPNVHYCPEDLSAVPGRNSAQQKGQGPESFRTSFRKKKILKSHNDFRLVLVMMDLFQKIVKDALLNTLLQFPYRAGRVVAC